MDAKPMKIDDLIRDLQNVRDAKGNINVVCGSFCGTNNGFVVFDIEEFTKPLEVDNHISVNGLSIHIKLQESSRRDILDGIRKMEQLGYTYYRSQYMRGLNPPRTGPPVCEWHIPW